MIDDRTASAIIAAIAGAHPDDQLKLIAMLDNPDAQCDAAGVLAILRLSG
ncbi:hypothetical protein Tco_0584594, partial [Tanacetum coccineum]